MINEDDNHNTIREMKDYQVDQRKYDMFLKSRKSFEYKVYAVYDLDMIGPPSGADFLLRKSAMVKNPNELGGYATF